MTLLNDIINYCSEELRRCRMNECHERSRRGAPSCRIRLQNNVKFLCFSGDQLLPQNKSCDCIIIIENESIVKIYFIELKNKSIYPSDIEEKFETTMERICQEFVNNNNLKKLNEKLRIYYILVCNKIDSINLKQITRKRIVSWKGKRHKIILGKCNQFLGEIVEKNV